jgi:hypothetical protein
MHFFTACVVPRGTTRAEVDDVVAPMMAPFDETENDDGWWDWWQVGGRWTGVWSEYNPTTDPANIETCKLCGGTGTRRDMTLVNGCNGCGGKGAAVTWPTQWVAVDDDIVPVPLVTRGPENTSLPIYLVLPDGRCLQRETWDGENWNRIDDDVWRKSVLDVLADYEDHAIVAMDIHS